MDCKQVQSNIDRGNFIHQIGQVTGKQLERNIGGAWGTHESGSRNYSSWQKLETNFQESDQYRKYLFEQFQSPKHNQVKLAFI